MRASEGLERTLNLESHGKHLLASKPFVAGSNRRRSAEAPKKWNAALVACSLVMMVFAALTIALPSTEGYVSHSPILITSNSEFDGDHGVNGGSGTALDPWIISNWEISASSGNAIEIRDTTDHFVIRGVHVSSSTPPATWKGIYLDNVTHGGVESSVMTGDVDYGVFVHSCSDVEIRGNNITDISGTAGVYVEYSSRTVVTTNNISAYTYCVLLVYTDNYTISNNTISYELGGGNGIHFGWSPNGTISGNSISNVHEGIRAYGEATRNVTILENTILDAGQAGIYVLTDTSRINISGNRLENAVIGLQMCSGVSVLDNDFSDMSVEAAVYFNQAFDVTMRGNVFTSTGIYIWGTALNHYNTHTISQDNLIDGRPLCYYKDSTGLAIDGASVGELILANCTDFEAKNLVITDAYVAVQAAYSKDVLVSSCNMSGHYGFAMDFRVCSNVTVSGSLIADNRYGVYCSSSLVNATFANNTITGNAYPGFKIWYSSRMNITGNMITSNGLPNNQAAIELINVNKGNITENHIADNYVGIYLANNVFNVNVYHNNFVNNTIQVFDALSNTWDNGYPSGGNYWDDYTGTDGDLDGIGDDPYVIDSDSQDDYPLMQPVPEFHHMLLSVVALIGIVTLMARIRGSTYKIGGR